MRPSFGIIVHKSFNGILFDVVAENCFKPSVFQSDIGSARSGE
jgi:hypothetical protein